MTPRSSYAPRRAAAAEGTRQTILEAARSLLAGRGDLAAFSIDAVAKKAGVARMTVYYQFKSRAGLLDALSDHLAHRGGMHRMRTVFAAPTLEEGLRQLVEVFVGFWATDRIAMRRLRALGVTAPERSAAPRGRDEWRREAVSNLLARQAGAASKAGAPSSAELVDTLTALTSFEFFDQLCTPSRKPSAVSRLIYELALGAIRTAG